MTTLAVDVRRAEPGDAVAISETHRAAWQHAYSGLIPYRTLISMVERRGHSWWQRAIRGSTSILVLEVEDTIAGYATLGLNRARSLPQEGEIYELYLRPEYQGIGLGSRLFSEARRLLGSLGCKGMVVWTLEENDRAVNFYSALGGIDIAEGSETFDKHPLRKIAFVWP
ncbi:GNAT family N-acetyltransferase [Hoeflea prorocentri]|uniref:GNAT family N-acetyltransferase n=1 Tax=Hoeflea prorocentri TaxID=1922333 RepID=A0A9X3UMD5_9HYPH|nr:GNAT family N-acetyltransferase [Hoeflea prorocentri]MCY6383317.1 GNAT family N-acetyltransferase [Hoeflea prorocentri]MDA5401117.1 GNAT family N-acetyltransferase [Hoeflea prorocentri]